MRERLPIHRLDEPRFLDEVGYFLYYEKEMRWNFADYTDERRSYSRLHLEEVLGIARQDEAWIRSQRVLNIGAGCSCAIVAWPCRSKVSIDPLADVYQNLGMLIPDEPGTPETVFIAASTEEMLLVEGSCDLAYCRNALNHMERPGEAVRQIARVVCHGGSFYLDVDLDGIPTPDEPVSLSEAGLRSMLAPWFEIERAERDLKPFSIHSPRRLRMFLRRNANAINPQLNKKSLLAAYIETFDRDPGIPPAPVKIPRTS